MADARVGLSPKENSAPANTEKNRTEAGTPGLSTSHFSPQGLSVSGASSDDIPLTHENILLLQRTIGNRAVVRLLQRKEGLSQTTLQKKNGPGSAADQPEPEKEPSDGSSGRLPGDMQARMEAAFGADFSEVRIHQDSQADSLGALAYTQGSDIHIASGRYDPHTQAGKELIGHELAHVVQQSEGRVAPTGAGKGLPLNDDPALEQEADDLGARAARGEAVGRAAAASSGRGGVVQTKADPEATEPEDVAGSGEESVSLVDAQVPEVTAQLKVAPGPIQARAPQGVVQRQKKKKTSVPYQIHVTTPMTQAEFRLAAMRQIFGGAVKNIEWSNSKDSYVPANSPYRVHVDVDLLKHARGQARKDRDISLGPEGIAGSKGRAKAFHAGPESDEKSALLKEIDRRYYEEVGDKTQTKIKPGQEGKSELWRMIRDEVLFQHEYIVNLPPSVKELIRFSTKGRNLTPVDYDKLFAIAKKIEKMPAGQVIDYSSKVTATTTDLDAFEASLDKYIAETALRSQESEERDKIRTKLIGLEEVYKKYQLYKTMLTAGSGVAITGRYGGGGGGGIVIARRASQMRQELETELQAHGFAGVADFEAFIKKFEKAFEQGAVHIAKDLMGKYAGRLYKESERYRNPAEITALHQRLGGFRQSYAEFEANAAIWNEYVRTKDQHRIPGQGHMHPRFSLLEAEAAKAKAETAKATAQSQFKDLSSDHPIFQEEDLPLDKRIDKAALAKATESELAGLLQRNIQNRMKDIDEARAELEGKSEVIYKMDKLMPHFYAQLGIKPDSIHDMIIRDKMKEDAILKLVKGIAFAVVAIALAVVTFGAATPVIVAAGAGVLGAVLSGYQVYEAYQEYTQEKNLADVGFAKDPSVIWLVIAVAGAALDMSAAVNAVSKLGKAAKALDAGGDLAEFTKVVAELEKANEITARVARAAEKAAEARKAFAEASRELTRTMLGKSYSFPGPLADPEVYKAVVNMARQAIKAKFYDATKFIEELKLARVNAGLGNLTPEELAKAKQAWEEAKVLEAAEAATRAKLASRVSDVAKLDALIAKAGDAGKLERLLNVFPETELDNIFAQLADTSRLVNVLDHLGVETGAGVIRGWMSEGAKGFKKMNLFLERLAAGGKELSEASAVGAKAVIIDSNTAIALMKDADPALRATLQPGEKAWVAYIKSLPADTELRVANVTVGEIKGGVINVKGVPISVSRESSEYQKVFKSLADQKVGTSGGFADRGLIADAIFARVDPGVVPKLITGDKNAVKNLARMATPPIDVVKAGGYPGLAAKYGATGFEVTVEGRKLMVVPLPVP